MHRKIIVVKVELSVIEISESVHWSRRCYAISFISVWNEILLGSQGTVNQTTSCQHMLSKKNECNTLERYGCVGIEIKHLYKCFIAVIKYFLINTCTTVLVWPYFAVYLVWESCASSLSVLALCRAISFSSSTCHCRTPPLGNGKLLSNGSVDWSMSPVTCKIESTVSN